MFIQIFLSLISGLVVFLILYIIILELKKLRINKLLKYPFLFGKHYPIIGTNRLIIGRNNVESMSIITNYVFDVELPAKAWFGPKLYIFISDPDDMNAVLSSDITLQKGYNYEFFRNETGLFTAKVDQWKQHRRFLNPTFSTKILNSFCGIFNERARLMADNMAKDVGGQTCHTYKYAFKCTADMIVATQMGCPMDLQSEKGDDLYECFVKIAGMMSKRTFNFFHHPNFIYYRTKAFANEMVEMRKLYDFERNIQDYTEDRINTSRQKGVDILKIEEESGLLKYVDKCYWLFEKRIFNKSNIKDHIETILIGGIETTALTISNFLLMISIHQDVQERVVNELRDIFDRVDSDVTGDDMAKMNYTEMVVKESLRLYPVGPYLSRECVEPFKLRDNVLPKGSTILLCFYKMHRDPKIWGPDVLKFNPDNFTPDKCRERHPNAYLPFSGGARNCIGMKYGWMSIKTMIAHLLRRYKFTTDLRMEDIITVADVTLKIVNSNEVRVTERKFLL